MKAAVSLRLTAARSDFQVFFPYSDTAVRTALLGAGVRYEAATRGYLLPATPEAVAPVQAACAALGVALLVPIVPALAAPAPPPTPHEVLLATASSSPSSATAPIP